MQESLQLVGSNRYGNFMLIQPATRLRGKVRPVIPFFGNDGVPFSILAIL